MKKRDSSWTMIQPGCYVDPEGRGHLFPDEVIAELQRLHPEAAFEYTRADYDLVVEIFLTLMREICPAMRAQFIHHQREAAS